MGFFGASAVTATVLQVIPYTEFPATGDGSAGSLFSIPFNAADWQIGDIFALSATFNATPDVPGWILQLNDSIVQADLTETGIASGGGNFTLTSYGAITAADASINNQILIDALTDPTQVISQATSAQGIGSFVNPLNVSYLWTAPGVTPFTMFLYGGQLIRYRA